MQKVIPGLLLLIVVCITEVRSQNIKNTTIKWTCSEIFLASEGNLIMEKTNFFTYTGSKLEWRNEDGSIRATFQIIKVKGEWNDPAQDGILQYEVLNGQENAIVTILKKNNELKIVIVYTSTDEPKVVELPVESYTEL